MSDLAVVTVAGAVAGAHGIEAADVFCRTRTKTLGEARGLAMAIARDLLGRSFPELARAFGRDHTTVMYHVAHVAELRKQDGFAAFYDTVRSRAEAALGRTT